MHMEQSDSVREKNSPSEKVNVPHYGDFVAQPPQAARKTQYHPIPDASRVALRSCQYERKNSGGMAITDTYHAQFMFH